jgi:hypothetical protein
MLLAKSFRVLDVSVSLESRRRGRRRRRKPTKRKRASTSSAFDLQSARFCTTLVEKIIIIIINRLETELEKSFAGFLIKSLVYLIPLNSAYSIVQQ